MNKKLILLPVLALLLTGCGNSGQKTSSNSQSSQSTSSVTSSVNVPVEGVSLNKTSVRLLVGESVTVKATITPANASNLNVTWTSSNTAVATVTGGKITAVAGGEADVTVKTEDGNKEAVVHVEVNTLDYGTEDKPLTPEAVKTLVMDNVAKGGFTEKKVWCEGVVYTNSYYSGSQVAPINGYLASSDESSMYAVQLYGIGRDESLSALDIETPDGLVGYTIKVFGYVQNYNDSTAEFNKFDTGEKDDDQKTIYDYPMMMTAKEPYGEATAVNIISPAINTDVGLTGKMDARKVPLHAAGAITWTSSDTTVATVDANGVVTGLKAGTAQITAHVGSVTSQAVNASFSATVGTPVYLNVSNLKYTSSSYSTTDKDVEIGGVTYTSNGWAKSSNYSCLQGRKSKSSYIKNKSAMPGNILMIKVVLNATAGMAYANSKAFTFESGAAAASLTGKSEVDTVKGQLVYTYTPANASDKYFKFSITDDHAFYIDFIGVYYEA